MIIHKLPVVVKLLALKSYRMPPLPLRLVCDVTYVHAARSVDVSKKGLHVNWNWNLAGQLLGTFSLIPRPANN